ncbi:MAG: hypothetical protein KAT25_04780 [Sulfuriflexus sp.]|nr:hypothetical protein [Sulfuriflexus sp.]
MIQTAEYLNLRRLFMLRNIAIIGQLLAVYITQIYLDIALPVLSIGLVIFTFALFNLFTLFRIRWGGEVSQLEFLFQLLADVFILTALLYLTGGATNPFVLLFLLPIIIATAVLSSRYTWILTLITAACYSLLIWKFQPLPHAHGSGSGLSQHVFGMWLSFVISAAITSYLVGGMRRSLEDKEVELAAAREQQLRDEQLVLLGTLSASTAHEMGTPLGTMSLLCEELSHELSDEHQHIAKTLNTQITRCKDALSTLSASTGTAPLSAGKLLNVNIFLEELHAEWNKLHPDNHIKTDWNGISPAPSILADRTLQQALINILDNANEASPNQVEWIAYWDSTMLTINIKDRGEGLSREAEQAIGNHPFSDKAEGHGLGLFLTHSILKRFGGHVESLNREHGGLSTLINLPIIKHE